MDYIWVNVEELRRDIEMNPSNYSVWLKIALEKIRSSQINEL